MNNKAIPTIELGYGGVGVHVGILKTSGKGFLGFSLLEVAGGLGEEIADPEKEDLITQVTFKDKNSIQILIEGLTELSNVMGE
jgi:hypothetical protein